MSSLAWRSPRPTPRRTSGDRLDHGRLPLSALERSREATGGSGPSSSVARHPRHHPNSSTSRGLLRERRGPSLARPRSRPSRLGRMRFPQRVRIVYGGGSRRAAPTRAGLHSRHGRRRRGSTRSGGITTNRSRSTGRGFAITRRGERRGSRGRASASRSDSGRRRRSATRGGRRDIQRRRESATPGRRSSTRSGSGRRPGRRPADPNRRRGRRNSGGPGAAGAISSRRSGTGRRRTRGTGRGPTKP